MNSIAMCPGSSECLHLCTERPDPVVKRAVGDDLHQLDLALKGWKQKAKEYEKTSLIIIHQPEEFENGGFTLKIHQMFSIHTLHGRNKKRNNHWSFGFVFEEK